LLSRSLGGSSFDCRDEVFAGVVILTKKGETHLEEGSLLRYFFGRGVSWFLLGILAKAGAKTWSFGGQLVVACVVNVANKQSVFRT
jgi:hypothetical protein